MPQLDTRPVRPADVVNADAGRWCEAASRPPRRWSRTATPAFLTVALAGLVIAGTVHVGVALIHGIHTGLFVAVGAAQLAGAVLLIRGRSRPILASVALLSAALASTWAASRAGIGIAPHPIGLVDITAAGAHIATAVSAAVLSVGLSGSGSAVGRPRLVPVAVTALVTLAVVLLAPAGGHQQGHREMRRAGDGTTEAPNLFGDLFDHHSFDDPHDRRHAHPRPTRPPYASSRRNAVAAARMLPALARGSAAP